MPVIDAHSHPVPRGWPDLAEVTGDPEPWPRLRVESEREAMILIGDRDFRRITHIIGMSVALKQGTQRMQPIRNVRYR